MAKKRNRKKSRSPKRSSATPKKTTAAASQPESAPQSKKLWPVIALVVIAGLVAIGVLLLPGPSPAPAPPSGEVFPVEVESPRQPRAESMFAAVDPNRDRWKSEAVNEELEGALKKVAAALPDDTALMKILSSELRSVALEPKASTPKSASPGMNVTDVVFDDELSLDRESFVAAFSEWLSELETIDYAKFKVVAVDLADDSERLETDQARTEMLFELSGKAADGGLLARRIEGALGWHHKDGTWKIAEVDFNRGTKVSAPAAPFTDVSSLAFADLESYRRQMALGINDFRTRLDAASGVDVFAHNGVSVVDVDGDGFEDLFVAQPAGLPNRLYRNQGDGTFDDVSSQAGVDVLDRTSMGLFADFDDDGDDDLALILQNGEPILFTNDGRGSFARSPARFERADGADVTYSSAAAADYDGDGDVDLYVCAYLTVDAPGADKELPLPYPYHDAQNGAANVLFRNQGDGTFEDATAQSGLDAGNDRFSFAASWNDYNDDGLPDLYVANDFGRNNLYENEGGGRFEEVSAEAGVEDLGAGMSVAWSDYDHDGDEDLYVGNMWSSAGQRLTHQTEYHSDLRAVYARHAKGSSLFRNQGNGRFDEVSEDAGVELGRWAWGSDFIDFDNDGDEDLYVANGYITNRSSRDL